jgi:hypothetical protein
MEPNSLAQSIVDLLGSYFQNREKLASLRVEMVNHFNESELRNLSFDLQINYDALPGSGTDNKCRELILYCLHRGRLAELLSACAKQRPTLFNSLDNFQELKADFEKGTVVYESLNDHFVQDAYYLQTLTRLAERPDSDSRRSALNGLLQELIANDPALVKILEELFQEDKSHGDNINQQVTLSDHVQAGDINLIGKVEGVVDLSALKEQKKL